MTTLRPFAPLALILAAGACAQPEPRAVIQGAPVYGKFGGVIACEAGLFIPGAPLVDQCLPPLPCVEARPGAAPNPDCPPPGRRPPVDDPRDPTRGGLPGAAPRDS